MKPFPDGVASIADLASATSTGVAPRVLTVLPMKERFAFTGAGAISLLVRRMALPGETVVGAMPTGPVFDDVPFRPVPKVFSLLGARAAYAKGVCQLINQLGPDLVEVHNRPDLALALHKVFPNLPMVLVLHNDPCGMRRARTAAERTKLARCVAVVAVSEWIRERFVSQGTQACVTVLHNSLDFSQMPPPTPLTERAPVLLYAGRVVADKGVDSYVAACGLLLPRYPQWRAVMMGADRFGYDSPQTPFLNNLLPKARAAGVDVQGYQPHAAVLQAMSKAAILVVPSRWAEPFGTVALEGMGSGAALVTTRNGGLPYVAGPAAVYVDPDDPVELAAQLERLMCDAPLRESYAQAGLERARQFDSRDLRARRGLLQADVVRAWPGRNLFQD